MDQLKVALAVLKKHYFWLLCIVCTALGFVGWSMASKKLSAEYSANKSAILGKFTSLDTIANTPDFPNSKWKEEVDKLTTDQKKKVRVVWQKVYDEQSKMLTWPDYLGEDFLKHVKSRAPGSDLDPRYCERYSREIQREFPKLLAIIGAEASNKERTTTGGPAGAVAPAAAAASAPAGPAEEDRVVWAADSQERVDSSLHFAVTPPSQVVWLTQENLWAYQAILTIIKNVNAGEVVPKIRKIEELTIAQKAAETFSKGLGTGLIDAPAAPVGGEAAAAAPADIAPPSDAGGGDPAAGAAPDDRRYLDAEGKPLPAGGAAKEQFKRMPVFLRLVMDQRQIPKLLVECANSPLPLDVRQLRINPSKGQSAPTQPNANAGTLPARGSYDVPIEIGGVITIYNPPDMSRLGGDAADGAAPPADPAAAPGG